MVSPVFSHTKGTDLHRQIKWIISVRIIFSLVLSASCLAVFDDLKSSSLVVNPFVSLYYLSGILLSLSVGYGLWLKTGKNLLVLAYVQMTIDTFAVTVILFLTGTYDSVFTFLYPVVIICSAMLLQRKGSLLIATLASIQYGILIELEYYHILPTLWGTSSIAADPTQVIYRIMITIAAFYAVAFLSGILALQLKMARRDLKIAQRHLTRVEKMETVDEMISGIAHEIKNPLASLSGSIQLLQEDTRPGSHEDKLMKIILRETERLKSIVNDIRVFAKPSRADAVLVNITRAVEDVVTLFLNNPQWNQRIQVYTRLEENLHIMINPIHLKQILWNLIKNSAEAIPGKGKITIALNCSSNRRIYLSIKDNGQGILPKEARHIFDPFFTTKPEGTGLGLSIIHRLIDTYEGMIDFDSIHGKGSVFTIIFKKPEFGSGSTKS